MKKRKIALVAAFAAVSALALASCNNTNTSGSGTGSTPASTGSTPASTESGDSSSSSSSGTAKRLDIYYTYDGYAYVDSCEQFTNAITNTQYADGNILPVWKLYGEKINADIRNACKHDGKKATAKYDTVVSSQFSSEIDPTQKIDLYGNTVSNINAMGGEGNAVDLMEYVEAGKMPNLARFIEENPNVAEAMMVDGALYFTPYFDGHDKTERMLLMDTKVLSKLLNPAATGLDTTASGTASSTKTVREAQFSPFIDAEFNLPKDGTATTKSIQVSKNSTATNITVNIVENIIKQQNTLLNSGNATGASLHEQFMTYLQNVYGANVGAGKTYANYAEIFASESAAYTTDELIALLRVFRANPSFISNGKNDEVVPLIPREQNTSRIDNILQFAGAVFGVQGFGSESERLFFTADGKLADAATEKASYDALELLADIYKEGLLLDKFYQKTETGLTKYAQHYFAKSIAGNNDATGGYALMEYDYVATQSAFNLRDDNGVGTASNKVAADYEIAEIKPVLAPITWWANQSFTHNQPLSDHTNKNLIRYYEENRALKSDSWCIPTTADNKDDAVKLMDYLLSDEGQIYNDFGPEIYHTATNALTYGNQTTPALTPEVIAWYADSGIDFWKFNRRFIGTTDAIGYIRTSTIDYQATNVVARAGVDYVNHAVLSGVQKTCIDNTASLGFGTSVPAVGWPQIAKDTILTYDSITAFWDHTDKLNAKAFGWCYVVVNDLAYGNATDKLGDTKNSKAAYTYSSVVNEMTIRNVNYLGAYAQTLALRGHAGVVPSYALPQA